MGTAYESVNWETDQRPDWWISHTLIWEFRLPTETTFATSSLEDAAYRLANRLRRPLEEARRAVFTGIPLNQASRQRSLWMAPPLPAIGAAPTSTQVARLAQLQAFLDAFREGVISDVLVDFTNASERGEADALMDESDRTHYLGVNARTLKQWALEYQAYEVTDFLKHYRKPEAASQAVEAVVADPRRAPGPCQEAQLRHHALRQLLRRRGLHAPQRPRGNCARHPQADARRTVRR